MENLLFILMGFVISLLMGMIIIPRVLIISFRKRLFDTPDARKIHTLPIPRLGGVMFFPAILFTMCFLIASRIILDYKPISDRDTFSEYLFFLSGLTLLYIIGIADDLIGVRYRKKFVIQILAALMFPLAGLYINDLYGIFGIHAITPFIGIPLTLLLVVFITNAINLIDGIDGLASGLCMVALAVYGIVFAINHQWIYALLSFVSIGVIIPFFRYNVFGNARKGHKLFMGDTGSLTLGFILSFLVLHICQADNTASAVTNNWKIIVALSSLLVPLFDVVRVSLHRIRKHRNPFLPDKNHIHHKLMRAGMTRVCSVLITIIAIDVFFIIFNAVLADKINSTILLLIDITIYTAIHIVINYFIRKNNGGPSYIPVEELAKSEPELAKELGLDKTQGADQSVILNGSEESEKDK